ncbi:MAG: FIST N-terminal domain-containing protein [Polyangiaceae bacterium]
MTVKSDDTLEREVAKLEGTTPTWAMLYGVEDSRFAAIMSALRRRYPKISVFGTTSFRGVFTRQGFIRNPTLLVADADDEIVPAIVLQPASAEDGRGKAQAACRAILKQLGKPPNMLLLHATPGFEERILAGVHDVFGTDVPLYGGSAADDKLAGKWQIFADGEFCGEGFLLVGMSNAQPPSGGFLSGYLPTDHGGRVTRAKGRIVFEIDDRPAAEVYNTWTNGAIATELERGGDIMSKTNLLPVARTVGNAHSMPRRLLAHPREVVIDGVKALSFFAELTTGEGIGLMTSTRDPLVSRVRRAVQRARGATRNSPRGALLVYCAGCLGVMLDKAGQIAEEFAQEVGDVPFVGICTFGEQGTFFEKTESWHGNLMCSAVLF